MYAAGATLMREGWGKDDPVFRQLFTSLFIPGASREQMDWFNELQKRSVTPENAWRLSNAFADADVSDDVARVSVPTLILHGDDDQIVPIADSAHLAIKLLKNGTLKVYETFPHGMCTTHPEIMLRIDASTDIADLDHSDIDVGVRMGDGSWPGVRAELLFAQCMFPVCAPVIAARLKSVEDLAHEWVIREESGMVDWTRWFAPAGASADFAQKNSEAEKAIDGNLDPVPRMDAPGRPLRKYVFAKPISAQQLVELLALAQPLDHGVEAGTEAAERVEAVLDVPARDRLAGRERRRRGAVGECAPRETGASSEEDDMSNVRAHACSGTSSPSSR